MEKYKTAVILLSRQHRRPSLQDEWVRQLVSAVRHVKHNGWMLNSSVCSSNWEIITAAAVSESVPIQLYLPISESGDFEKTRRAAACDFGLANLPVKYEMVLPNDKSKGKEDFWKYRDRVISELSDIFIPVAVRPQGLMTKLLQEGKNTGKKVIDDFQVEYDSTSSKLSYSIEEQSFSDSINQIGQRFVIHWTRASNGPWPGEKKIDYYREILNSREYPRTAFKTLKKIIEERQIIPSAKNMPGKTATVSFSGLAPIETIKLMKWRARYQQMSFEPYGIGVEKETALSVGISEVQYYRSKSRRNDLAIPSWLTQSIGKITDWRCEKEFRYKGNFDLKKIAVDKLIAVCFHKSEGLELQERTGVRSIWFCD